MANKIKLFFQCRKCLAEMPKGESPASWSRLDAGWTIRGFQVWCRRHDVNVIHVDFEGAKHPADQGVRGEFGASEN